MDFGYTPKKEGRSTITDNLWRLLNYGTVAIQLGEEHDGKVKDYEALLVEPSEKASMAAGGLAFSNVGAWPPAFADGPRSMYLTPDCSYCMVVPEEAVPFEAALLMAEAKDEVAPVLIEPSLGVVARWKVTNASRGYYQISATDILPRDVVTEEMYYLCVSPPDGRGLTKYYTENESINEVSTVEDNTILKMPKGYRTVVSVPGYTTYSLWFLTGNTRIQAAVPDPQVGCVDRAILMIRNIEENLS